MKTAICISGQLRCFDDPLILKNVFQYIINPLNADVFISTWRNRGSSFYLDWNKLKHSFDKNEIVDIQKIIDLYHPKKINVEDYNEWEKNGMPDSIKNKTIKNGIIHNGLNAMFYKIYDANNLRKEYEEENNIKYDLVIRSRFDLIFVSPIEEEYLKNLNVLWNNNCPYIYLPYRVHDTFNFANAEIMNKFSEIYLNLPTYWADSRYPQLERHDPPRIIKVFCAEHNILDKSFKDRFYDVYYDKDYFTNFAGKQDIENRKIIDKIQEFIKDGVEFEKLSVYVYQNNFVSIYNWLVHNHYIRKEGDIRYWEF